VSSKAKSLFLIALMLLMLSTQVVNGNSQTNIRIGATIIEPEQELFISKPITFKAQKIKNIIGSNNKTISEAGKMTISSNLPWQLNANIPELQGVDVYLKSNLNRKWIKLNSRDQVVLTHQRLDKANLSWDVKIVADRNIKIQPFKINFDLDWQKTNVMLKN